jgi:hypothetical protein
MKRGVKNTDGDGADLTYWPSPWRFFGSNIINSFLLDSRLTDDQNNTFTFEMMLC